MKSITLVSLITFIVVGAQAYAEDCTAPESVKKVVKLLEASFSGQSIECDDGNKFSLKQAFKCEGDKFIQTKGPDEVTTLPSGEEVFLVTTVFEQDGNVRMTEIVFDDFESYEAKAKPRSTTPTQFMTLSEKSFGFYSDSAPKPGSWILSTWFLDEDGKLKGYKLFENKAVTCTGKS